VGKPEGNIPLRRLRCRLVDNIKMDLGEMGQGSMGWMYLTQTRGLVNVVLNLQVP
jgi:hypothetical protein